ncbi:hypothetical protein QUF64_09335 [Anaerolineales bacterium HSG6]|nr:hypothetical protein [Anaerolineales bacterium HSG6]
MGIRVHSVTTIAECHIVEQLQQSIWGCDDTDVIPGHILITIAKESGMICLVYDELDEVIGFIIAFLALHHNKQHLSHDKQLLKLASHQVGVISDKQNKQLGYQIKLAQRDMALARGIELITWTFDPLQGRNARLNLHKLGAVSQTYYRNIYGNMNDGFNGDLDTDRFLVEWWLDSDHVKHRLDQPTDQFPSSYTVVNPITESTSDGFLLPSPQTVPFTDQTCFIELPADMNMLTAMPIARQWQQQIAYLFETAFETGYTVTDLLRHSDRNYFVLEKNWSQTE